MYGTKKRTPYEFPDIDKCMVITFIQLLQFGNCRKRTTCKFKSQR